MILRIATFALIALGLAGFGTVAWISIRAHPAPRHHAIALPAPPVMTRILVGTRSLRPGMLVQPEDFRSEAVEKKLSPKNAVLDTPEARAATIGGLVRRSIPSGAPLLRGDVLQPGEHGFAAAMLKAGMRAITIKLAPDVQGSALLWPGDHIDLILISRVDAPAQQVPAGWRYSAETVLQNLRVIAVDQELVQGASSNNKNARAAHTITVEVTPEQAERLTLAEQLGTLQFSIRSAEAAKGSHSLDSTRTESPLWASDVSGALLNRRGNSVPTDGTVLLYQGASDGKEFHF